MVLACQVCGWHQAAARWAVGKPTVERGEGRQSGSQAVRAQEGASVAQTRVAAGHVTWVLLYVHCCQVARDTHKLQAHATTPPKPSTPHTSAIAFKLVLCRPSIWLLIVRADSRSAAYTAWLSAESAANSLVRSASDSVLLSAYDLHDARGGVLVEVGVVLWCRSM